MNRKIAALLVTASIVTGVGFGFLFQRGADQPANANDQQRAAAQTTADSADTDVVIESEALAEDEADEGATDEESAVTEASNDSDSATGEARAVSLGAGRADRTGPSWSPMDLVGPDGEFIELGFIKPGSLAPLKAGMSVKDAVAAGLVVRDKEQQCMDGPVYRFAGDWYEGLNVDVQGGVVVSISMHAPGAETAEGVSIGNSLGYLKAVYGPKLSGPSEMEYGDSAYYVSNGDKWIGFAFAEAPSKINDSSRIVYMEMNQGERPGMFADGGC